jgi:hypothetical protein
LTSTSHRNIITRLGLWFMIPEHAILIF